jgi:hypothetical protein
MAGVGFEVCGVQAECVDWNRRGCSLPIEYPTFSNSGLLKKKIVSKPPITPSTSGLWRTLKRMRGLLRSRRRSIFFAAIAKRDDNGRLIKRVSRMYAQMKHYWDNRSSDILGSIYTVASLEVQQISLCTSWNFHSLCFVFKDRQTRMPEVRWMLHFQKLSKLVLRVPWL